MSPQGIDTAMMASMREAIKELLPDTCDIYSVTEEPDGMGGTLESLSQTGSHIPFRLDVLSGTVAVAGGGAQPYTSYKGSLPWDTEVEVFDRIVHLGSTYKVTGTNEAQSWQAVCRVDLEWLS